MGPTKNQNKYDFRITAKKCQLYDRGYSKYKEKCTNKHPDKVCDDPNCSEDKCDKRHPNPCKYGQRCRFSRKKVCLYSHDTLVCDDSRMNALAKKVEAFEKQISVLSNKLDNFVGPGVLACATRGGGRSEAGHCFHLLFSFFSFFSFFFLLSTPSTFHPLRGISRA